MSTVRFYFSFRSPYAWIAFRALPEALRGLPVEVQRIPVFPPPYYPNDPGAVPAKIDYIMQHDLPRLAEGYGLPLSAAPAPLDADWIRPHAMWLYADDHQAGDAFGREAFAARFSRGEDLGDEKVQAEIARTCGLDPEAAVAAGQDPALHQRVQLGFVQGAQDGIFGVPFFVYEGQRFWGHDRIAWLVRAIRRDAGLELSPVELGL